MKKKITLLLVVLGLFSVSFAQTTLVPDQFVNAQITGPGVYKVEAGKAYAFDGRIDLDYEITIEGPDATWIMEAENPPILVNTPADNGNARGFFELKENGAITVKNLIFSGMNSNGELSKEFIVNGTGLSMTVDNVCFTDYQNWALRNRTKGESISITNCVFINAYRPSGSRAGGFPIRMDVACDDVLVENNSVVNSGRLLANSGPFDNAIIHEIHNTYLNQSMAGHDQRAIEMLTVNNIFYNYNFLGYKTDKHSKPDNDYQKHYTTFNYFHQVPDLSQVSLYLGHNLFYNDEEILNWFDTKGGDSIAQVLLWAPSVDTFIINDDDYTIGPNFAEIDPVFTSHPGNTDKVVEYMDWYFLTDQSTDMPDWMIESPVTWSEDGTPVLSWPPAFDLSYSNSGLQTAGTDGLPLGDLNWFPDKKAEYLTNKDAFIASLRDSMVNAQAVYDPETMDETPLITEIVTSVKNFIPGQFDLSGNYPNPFDQSTTIEFKLPQQATVNLSIYNMLGRKVFEMTENDLPSGTHMINFNASELSSGMYMYKINAVTINGQKFVDTKKMIKE